MRPRWSKQTAMCEPFKFVPESKDGSNEKSLPTDVTVVSLTYHKFAGVVREVVPTPIDESSLQLRGVDFSGSIAIHHGEPLLRLWRHLGVLGRKGSGRSGIASAGLSIRIITLSLKDQYVIFMKESVFYILLLTYDISSRVGLFLIGVWLTKQN